MSRRIDINRCSYDELMSVPGIAGKYASTIMDARHREGLLGKEDFLRLNLKNVSELVSYFDLKEEQASDDQSLYEATYKHADDGNRIRHLEEALRNAERELGERGAFGSVRPKQTLPGSSDREHDGEREGFGQSMSPHSDILSAIDSFTGRPRPKSENPTRDRPDQHRGGRRSGEYTPRSDKGQRDDSAHGPDEGTRRRRARSGKARSRQAGRGWLSGSDDSEEDEREDAPDSRGRRTSGTNVSRFLSYDGKSKWSAFYLKFKTYARRESWPSRESAANLCFGCQFVLLFERQGQ
jgi:hypothetical protein